MSATSDRYQISIEADPTLPIIRMTREFDATPEQLMRASASNALSRLAAQHDEITRLRTELWSPE